MSDSFESDVMDDLFYESAEGPAQTRADEFDEFEGFEEYDAMEEDAYEDMDVMDAMEDAVADALEADDADEFFRRLARGIGRVARGVVRVARRVAPVVGRIARTVAPIASAIPLPWTQAIGRVAGVVGRLMADEADEFEAFDELMDLAEGEEAIDAAAPVIAGLAIRTAVPGAARLPRTTRRQLVRSVSQAVRTVARRQGPQAARAIPQIVRSVQRTAQRRGLPVRALPQAIQRTAARIARSTQLVRRLAGTPTPARRGGACVNCARARSFTLRGPVRISIQGQ
ncbi:MAG TPA: hypothetical protein PKY50_16685 [Candidatus Competibacter sp.]|nr:hypothetical protein [Candidatus Competibacter sp.]